MIKSYLFIRSLRKYLWEKYESYKNESRFEVMLALLGFALAFAFALGLGRFASFSSSSSGFGFRGSLGSFVLSAFFRHCDVLTAEE